MHRIDKTQGATVQCPNLTSMIQKHFGDIETLLRVVKRIGKRESELMSFSNDGELETVISTEDIVEQRCQWITLNPEKFAF